MKTYTELVTVRVTRTEKELLQRVSKRYGGISAFVRSKVREEARRVAGGKDSVFIEPGGTAEFLIKP